MFLVLKLCDEVTDVWEVKLFSNVVRPPIVIPVNPEPSPSNEPLNEPELVLPGKT
jgi:hypothetical protein